MPDYIEIKSGEITVRVTTQSGDGINDVIDDLIKPALLALGFAPQTVAWALGEDDGE